MKKERLSLKGIKNVLGRNEMKMIMAGSGNGAPACCVCYEPNCGSFQVNNTPGGCVATCFALEVNGCHNYFCIGEC